MKLEDYIKDLSIPFNNLGGLLSHLFYYDKKAYCQIVDKMSLPKEEEKLSKETICENLLNYAKKWNEMVENLNKDPDNIEKILSWYAHNNYHRGQINVIISILGYKTQSLDVFLYRSMIR